MPPEATEGRVGAGRSTWPRTSLANLIVRSGGFPWLGVGRGLIFLRFYLGGFWCARLFPEPKSSRSQSLPDRKTQIDSKRFKSLGGGRSALVRDFVSANEVLGARKQTWCCGAPGVFGGSAPRERIGDEPAGRQAGQKSMPAVPASPAVRLPATSSRAAPGANSVTTAAPTWARCLRGAARPARLAANPELGQHSIEQCRSQCRESAGLNAQSLREDPA